MFYQRTNAVDLFADIVHTRTEYSTLYFYRIGISWQDGINAYRIAISNVETGKVEFVNIEYSIFSSSFSVHTYRFLISITSETAGILEQGIDALVLFHLIEHRAFYLTRNVDQTVVWTHYDHIIVCKSYIACQLTIEDVVVDINYSNQPVVSIYLNITECTQIVGSSSHVEGMENGSEGREGIGSRSLYLTHHIDHDGFGLTHRQLDMAGRISAT